ncbi:PepSY domain-containing protein [Shinella sp. PSBB067]|uniref:PepSY domain-containing protein n=1 Tax=Rhizobiaceae TaxID=82115 RepID=UPI0003C56EC0|nr:MULTISPECIES: PepSY domain-containing protein [Rhizobiaceae]ANH08714.1 N-acetylglucosamine transferase [Shinella sp. HZN7]EYR79382.1 oxidoreductase [Shinella sp. DD12]MCD2185487.1 PepSY domain-containing protein [Rhizobium sp. GN54]QRI62511.1 PepSY domain-containing protein [Shinella sp. PSBB067]
MIRVIHRWPGLLAALFLLVLSLSGAALSLFPAAERLSAPQAEAGLSVGTLAGRILAIHPQIEQIRRAPSGKITAYWFEGGAPQAAIIDPATGLGVASSDPNAVEQWLTGLHRSLFLGDGGRIAAAVGAAAMLVLAVSGTMLVARRAGGWRRWFAPIRGPLAGRLHVEIARVAVAGLVLSSATALWMTASTFDLLPDAATSPVAHIEASGRTGMAASHMDLLKRTPVTELRSLAFPDPADATDVFTLKTDRGTGYLDQGTGVLLAWSDLTGWQRLSETIYMLHTGRGAATLGLVLGMMALGVPAMAGTGLILWLAGRRGRPRIHGNVTAGRAETILLVGSESGSTWSFAATLHAALTKLGQAVHTAPMSSFDPERYRHARRVLILAATYGDGDAPASARGFLDRLQTLPVEPTIPIAVLGFGDRSFPAYCAFAQVVARAAEARGWSTLIPYETVDRQSPQDFARWGRSLGEAIGIGLELVHRPALLAASPLTLVSRREYGAEVQAPTVILRFVLPKVPFWHRLAGRGFGRYSAGDLLGVLPEGSSVPRFYSLASGRRDGFIEIVVKKHPAGLCSGQLFNLEPGCAVRAFIRTNPGFHAGRSRIPLILIGAGTGIGPLAGFVRANARRRPIHLFFGMRHPASDFLYKDELTRWHREGRLHRLVGACSRGRMPRYVQHALLEDAAQIAALIRSGARIMVCGGRDMAVGVSAALAEILAPVGLTPALLKAEGRYVEDVY